MERSKGFSLIELMITVAVIGILAAVAYPSYQDQVRKSRRAEAQSALMDIGTRQQQRLLDTRTYAATTAALNVTVPPQVTTYYAISVSAPASTPPSFTATATPQGDQAKDKCGTLAIDSTGTKTAVKSGSAQTGCW
ncbi:MULTISPECIES: type IV pilin protein [unclassified Acidovorax]|uniref:type IV pilin protein n=1 Tax=unclassified Acidovorax TaxID=2684926 RepID=UPI0006F9CA81|nr:MULTISPECIES: type IV pilin protein [unclassified Acidovorax]KRB26535.1 pilus assembly protein [Acidovorax sp. Root70]PUA97746.1 type IV pilus assembly protein PilE [Acidovorax sp. 107]